MPIQVNEKHNAKFNPDVGDRLDAFKRNDAEGCDFLIASRKPPNRESSLH